MPDRPASELRWHRTTLDGKVATYGDLGDGDPVLFLHGWGLQARTYARTLPALARAGARVIAPALPGFGRSAPLDGPLSFERLAGWVDELLEHVGIDQPAFVVGHSMGGGVGTALAHHFPDRVRGLILVNAVGGAVWKPGGHEPGDADERGLAERPLWSWGLHGTTEWRRRGYRKALPVVARDLVGNALRNPRSLGRAARLARTADLRPELAALAERGLPVTILWGEQDRVVPEATFVAMCEATGATGDVIQRGGHSWLLADPDEFGEILTNSLTVHALLTRRSAS